MTLSFSGPTVSSDPACAPSEALLEAAPALRPDPPPGLPPAQLAAVVDVPPALVDRHARPWGGGDGIGFWVVAQLRRGVAVSNDRACVATIREGDVVESAVCAAAAEIRRRGAHEWVPVDGHPVVAGFAPTGATGARIEVAGQARTTVRVVNGAFAAILPRRVRMDGPDAYQVRFAYGAPRGAGGPRD